MKVHKFIVSLSAVALLGSCAADAPEIPEEEIYNREFVKSFGMPAASTWNSAERITATVSQPLLQGATDIRIYTSMPGAQGCELVAHYPSTASSFGFDLTSGTSEVFVEISDASRNTYNVYGYYPVNAGRLDVASRGSRADGDGKVHLGNLSKDQIDKGLCQGLSVYNIEHGGYMNAAGSAEWWRDLGYDDNTQICRLASLYQIKSGNVLNNADLGTRRDKGNSFTINDMMPLVGPGGVLVEQQCNLSLNSEKLNPTQGGEFVVTEDDAEINMEYFYGCGTANDRCFGYLYYTPENDVLDSPENLKKVVTANRYILIWNTNPTRNIFDCDFPNGGMALGNAVDKKDTSKTFTSSIRDLVYFGEDGNSAPSYKFPKGTHIIFFISVRNDRDEIDKSEYKEFIPYYSVPYLNDKYGRSTVASSHFNCTHGKMPGTVFATYKWNNRTVIGVDDSNYQTQEINPLGNDHDLNDILFYLNGPVENVRNKDEEMNEEAPVKQSWIIAAEDLGGTYDFDFNDVVVGISHVSGEETATVKALASGGTLPVYLHSKYPQTNGLNIGTMLCPVSDSNGEFHSWFGGNSDHTTIINARTYADNGAEVTLRVEPDFSLADFSDPGKFDTETGLGGFWITVHKPDGIKTIGTPVPDGGVAPQMFIAPSSWAWPTEETGIHTVYNGFVQWSDHWWERPISDDFVRHTWTPK